MFIIDQDYESTFKIFINTLNIIIEYNKLYNTNRNCF